VDERIQLDVTMQQDRPWVEPGRTSAWLGALLTNLGNGSEAFRVVAETRIDEPAGRAPGFDPRSPRVYLDDGSGVCDDGDVRPEGLVEGGVVTLEAGSAALVCVTAGIPDDAEDLAEGFVRIRSVVARANVDSLPAGSVLEDSGDGGSDALLATAGGTDAVLGAYVASSVAVTLEKSILRVTDGTRSGAPGGEDSGTFVPGAIVTYRLRVAVSGGGHSGLLELIDDLPAPAADGGGVTYVPGSMRVGVQESTSVAVTDQDDGVELSIAGVPVTAAILRPGPGNPIPSRLRLTFDDAPGDLDPAVAGIQPWTAVVLFDVEIL
jgi:hypothetical protein